MAKLDVDAFLTPISDDAPCGPDLDFDGDLEFMNFMARAEGLLPQSYFSFDRAGLDLPRETAAIEALLDRTRDLRLVVLHAKLSVLGRDLDGFARDLDVIAGALESRWAEVHPRGEGNDFVLRVVSVQSLDDTPDCLLPFQFAPLFENRRTGPITWRAWQIADGKVTPREGEATLDSGSIERAILDTDLAEVIARRDRIAGIVTAIERIDAASLEHGDYENRINLEKLKALADAIARFLDAQVARRDPSAAREPPADVAAAPAAGDDGGGAGGPTLGAAPAAASPGASATVAVRRDALRALAAAADYFHAYEPNSPSLLLVRFAQKISNRSFHDVVKIMMPDVASRASIPVAQSMFRVGLDKLTETVTGGWDQAAPEEETFDPAEEPSFAVSNRRDALRLLDLVVVWFRVAEPSSPLPLVVGRARELAERDFQTLLKEMFSDSALQSLKGDEWR